MTTQEKFEAQNFSTVNRLRRYRKNLKSDLKMQKLKRSIDPLEHENRSKAARLRWSLHRKKYIRGDLKSKSNRKYSVLVQTRRRLKKVVKGQKSPDNKE